MHVGHRPPRGDFKHYIGNLKSDIRDIRAIVFKNINQCNCIFKMRPRTGL